MHFGTSLPNQSPLANPESIRTIANRVEALGFDSIWLADHVVSPNQIDSYYPYSDTGQASAQTHGPMHYYYETLTTLAYVAAFTERLKLGTHVLIVPYRNPVVTAKVVSTIDHLSGGRVILGVGVGWMAEEFPLLAAEDFAERGAVTDEYIRLFKELWTQEEPNFEGRFYRFSDAAFQPKPIQKPHPPIWIGGHTRAALRRVAELGDGWIPIGNRPLAVLEPEELRQSIHQIREMAQKAGRSPDAIEVCFSASANFTNGGSAPPAGQRRMFAGTPEQIAEDIRSYQAVGVSHFNIGFGGVRGDQNQLLETMERFAKEVIPLV